MCSKIMGEADFDWSQRFNDNDFKRLCNRVSTYQSYLQQCHTYMNKYMKDTDDTTGGSNALAMRSEIFNYKSAMAKKNGKCFNVDKAFVDLSDCLEEFDYDCVESTRTAGYWGHANKQSIGIMLEYKGNICLPFKSCYLYTCKNGVSSHVMEINTQPDGTYTGMVYVQVGLKRYLQMSLEISHYGQDKGFSDNWWIKLKLVNQQRPLGQIFTNINSLLISIQNSSQKRVDEILENGSDLCIAVLSGLAGMVLGALSYTASYKSKLLYEVKGDIPAYVYSRSTGKPLQEYMETHYPNKEYSLVDGWLIDGYWKVLKKGETGKSYTGKLIPRLNWTVPYGEDYSEEQKQVVVSNSQKSTIVPIHALERAKERYDMVLSSQDLENIVQQVLAGTNVKKLTIKDRFGKFVTPKGRRGCYRLDYNNQTIDVVVSRCLETESYRVATFLPRPMDTKTNVISSNIYNEIMKDID